jgi:integrase
VKFCLDKGLGTNTIGSYIKNVKVFMNEAFDRKLTTNIEYKNRRFKTIEEETESIYLTKEEIAEIYSFDLSDNKKLDNVRDMFIIGCYTGLRYSDLMLINDKNLIDKNTKLKIKTEKTGELVIIPLHKYIREILKKHNGIPNYMISNQKMNEYLKELGELVGIKDKVLISSTKGGVKQNQSFKKFELITVHTARRSFATNAYLMDIPSISIMKITGHRTEKAFLKYIKISQEDNANKLINHPFFK